MIVEHLKAYEVALVVWSFLFGVLGLQGLISIYLEGETERAGAQAPPPAPGVVLGLMGALVALNVWAAWTFVAQLFQGDAPTVLARWAALMVLALAGLVGLYRRFFIMDEVIAQERNDGVPW